MPTSTRSSITLRLAAAALLGALTIVLIWQAAALPIVCPAIYPAPASCSGAPRALWACVGTSVTVVGLLLIVIGSLPRLSAEPGLSHPRRGLVLSGAWLLTLAAVAFPPLVAYSGGFAIDPAQIALLLAALAVCIVLGIVIGRTAGERPDADQVS